MDEYQDQVIGEHIEVGTKIIELYNFLHSYPPPDIDSEERELLKEQLYILMNYSDVLRKRIAAFVLQNSGRRAY